MRQSGEIGRERQVQIEMELLDTMKRLKKAGEGFELLIAPGEEDVWAAVLQNIMVTNPDYAVVMWPSGPGIVRRRDVDAINPDFKKINMETGFIVNGGDSFDADSLNPRPLDVGRVKDGDYEKAIPNAYELYDNHPALKPKE